MLEQSWHTMEDPANTRLDISPEEWKRANEAVQQIFEKGKNPPFKLSRKDLKSMYPDHKQNFNHSFIAIPDNKGGFKIAAMSRAKCYINASFGSGFIENIEEGILGHGAFGVVKIVQWENGDQDALKIQSKGEREAEHKIMTEIGVLKAQFLRERESLSDWIGGGKIKDKQYELLRIEKGKELKDYLKQVPIDTMDNLQKYEIAVGAALAIKGLHDRNILHCDIKPGNFMIDVTNNLTVLAAIDFGFSLKLQAGKNEVKGNAAGTPKFMAPEIKGKESSAIYSKSSDIYALGIMFRDYLKLAEQGSPLIELVKRMTADKPADRPTMTEITAALLNPETYKDYAEIYTHLGKYQEITLSPQKKSLTFLPKWIGGSPAPTELYIIAGLIDILTNDRRTKGQQRESYVKSIITLLQENQKAHGSTPSSFNLLTIQKLPDDLRKNVLEELGIAGKENLVKGNAASNQKFLAQALSEYRPKKLSEKGPGLP